MAKKWASSVFCPPAIKEVYSWCLAIYDFRIEKTFFADSLAFSQRRDRYLNSLSQQNVPELRALSQTCETLLTEYDYTTGTPEQRQDLEDAWEALRRASQHHADAIEVRYPSLQTRYTYNIYAPSRDDEDA